MTRGAIYCFARGTSGLRNFRMQSGFAASNGAQGWPGSAMDGSIIAAMGSRKRARCQRRQVRAEEKENIQIPTSNLRSNDDPVSARFTIDGGDKLEEQLSALCRRVCDGVRAIVPGR